MHTKHETESRRPNTAAELVAMKKAKANAEAEQAKMTAVAKPAAPPAVKTASAVAAPDTRPYRDRYLDEVAPASVVGRMVKFSKDGKFVTTDHDQEVPATAEFVALCDETLVGWVKFNGVGEPPDRVMGLLAAMGVSGVDGPAGRVRGQQASVDHRPWNARAGVA